MYRPEWWPKWPPDDFVKQERHYGKFVSQYPDKLLEIAERLKGDRTGSYGYSSHEERELDKRALEYALENWKDTTCGSRFKEGNQDIVEYENTLKLLLEKALECSRISDEVIYKK